MKRSIFKYIVPAAVCIAAVAGCTTDKTAPGPQDGQDAIRLQGLSTRAGTITDAPVYLVTYTDDRSQVYFSGAIIETSSPLNDTSPEDFTFINGQKYYPLGGREINLIAFTGDVDGEQMMLTGSQNESADLILSNYGKREDDPGIQRSYEGEGTPGSSDNPAEILQFRHVMTQLTVEVVLADDDPPVDSYPEKVEFQVQGMPAQGRYSIWNKEPETYINAGQPVAVATNYGSNLYTVMPGVNYVVSNGFNLAGETFSSLIIDDYVATADDRAKLKIAGSNGQTDMPLYPGYAYKMTLLIRKLELVGVILEEVDWATDPVAGTDPSYDPNQLELEISGGYENSGKGKITKLVLHSSSGMQYVGDADQGADLVNFVTLPVGALDSVEVYTSAGRLVTMPGSLLTYDPTQKSLSFNLTKVGMLLENPSGTNSPTNRYLLETPAQFLNIDDDLAGYYLQVADIELDEPGIKLGDFTGFGSFTGSYEGNGHWIGNANFISPGLFAENHGSLINIRIYRGNIDLSAGTTYAGSICAENYGLIYACINEASLFDAPATVGGICGLNGAGGRVIACLNTGNIRAGTVLGGICGENLNVDEKAFAACINTGNLWEVANAVAGGIIGVTTDSPDETVYVMGTCFWLDGTAQVVPGHDEAAVGQGEINSYDTTYLDPVKMRNGLDDGESETDRILYRLNNELNGVAGLPSGYVYVLDEVVTGITWPMPYETTMVP